MVTVSRVPGPAGWRGGLITDSDEWRYPLGDDERAELLAAVHAAEAAGVPLAQVTPEVFPLPALAARLRRLAGQVTDGYGLALLRDLPVDGLTERQAEILALGVACHVGRVVGQGPQRVPVLHVRDQGADPARPTTRSYQHNRRLGFHADPTDVVALLCLRPARAGGLSPVVSSVAVHNEIVRTRPDLARVLYQPWWYDRRTGDGPDSFHQQPVYRRSDDGRLVAHYGPDYIRSAQRGAHVPPLSAAQVAAMELVDRLNDELMFTAIGPDGGETGRAEPPMAVGADRGTLADPSTVDRRDSAQFTCVAQVRPIEPGHWVRLSRVAHRAPHVGQLGRGRCRGADRVVARRMPSTWT